MGVISLILSYLKAAGLEYHLFCLHTIFDYDAVSEVMMGSGVRQVKYFSILRDPVDRFLSQWAYEQMGDKYNVSLEEYVFDETRSDHNVQSCIPALEYCKVQ